MSTPGPGSSVFASHELWSGTVLDAGGPADGATRPRVVSSSAAHRSGSWSGPADSIAEPTRMAPTTTTPATTAPTSARTSSTVRAVEEDMPSSLAGRDAPRRAPVDDGGHD